MDESPITLYEFFSQEKKEWQKRLSVLESSEKMSLLKKRVLKEVKVKWPLAFGVITDKIEDILSASLPDIMVAAWKKYRILLNYADRERYSPDETFLVPMSEHTVKSEHHPSLEVLIDNKLVTEVKFDITVSLMLKGMVLKIQDGKIKGITTGTCEGKGTVKCENLVILQRETGPIALPGSIDFGEGIPIGVNGK